MSPMAQQDVTILGSTGSIGQSTLDVIARHPDRYRVYALSAHSQMNALAEQAHQFQARCVVVPDEKAAQLFSEAWQALPAGVTKPQVRIGAQALADTAGESEGRIVMAAIVGAAGLPAALAAAQAGKRVLLANKEALVAAGSFFMQAVRDNHAELLPIDSEHNAIFQCLPSQIAFNRHGGEHKSIKRLILTASGGPFRRMSPDQLGEVTPDQACAHPNWSMGRKISVDSATMLNKGLEVIEAHWLFGMPAHKIDVVIHPQSIIHSMVEYADGSTLAQMGHPDMRTPIAFGLAYPERIDAGVSVLDLVGTAKLEFEAVNLKRYPCLDLAYQALKTSQSACIALNAANEVAVHAFLNLQIRYLEIPQVVSQALEWESAQACVQPSNIGDVLAQDAAIRSYARQVCSTLQ